MGFNFCLALSFTVGIVAHITDYVLTKIALIHGFKEANPVYNLLKNKISLDAFLISGVVLYLIMLSLLLVVFRNATILLWYSMGSFFCVVANSLVMWSRFFDEVKQRSQAITHKSLSHSATTQDNLLLENKQQ
jgi:hypothetical protein